MAREGHKAQKRAYTAPQVRNVVSNRTRAYEPAFGSRANLSKRGRTGMSIERRADSLVGRLPGGLSDNEWMRRRNRVRNAAARMLSMNYGVDLTV